MKVLVTGYFEQANLGDDVFLYIWQVVMQKTSFDVEYSQIDHLSLKNSTNYDVLILAGGNLIGYYFINQINAFIITNPKLRILGYSLAIPYKSICVHKSDFFSKLSVVEFRSKVDARIFNLCGIPSSFSHDISLYIPELLEYFNFSTIKTLPNVQGTKIGIFLARTVCGTPEYRNLTISIASSINDILTLDPETKIFLIPFGTNEHNDLENDIIFNTDVYDNVEETMKNRVTNVCSRLSIPEMYSVFKNQLDFCINMRFHAHMFSIMCNVPFISLFTTNKVKELLQDMNYPIEKNYKMQVDENDSPINFSSLQLTKKITYALLEKESIINLIIKYKEGFPSLHQFISNVSQDIVSLTTPSSPPTFGIDYIKQCVLDLLSKLENKSKKEKSNQIATLVCYLLIKEPCPKYHYGLSEKVLNPEFDWNNELEWIWNDHISNNEFQDSRQITLKENNIPLFNMKLVSTTDMKNLHRSGWQYVVNNIIPRFHDDNSTLLFDNYIDRTFHWHQVVYNFTKVIPYKQKWCGFLHHTFDTQFSDYNSTILFQNPVFLESLKSCVAIFTLSEYLAKQVSQRLDSLNFGFIKVQTFCHPTDFPDALFSISKFTKNENRGIIQIGGWLRNSYSIYTLKQQNNNFHVKKYKLQGKNMTFYQKKKDLELQLDGFTFDFTQESLDIAIKLPDYNKWNIHFLQNLFLDYQSVETIDTLSNEEYDTLLSQNLVFIDLIDASAVNTVIECIVRNTPILINPLAAIVEMLGADYPFYWTSVSEANCKMADLSLIIKSHEYIKLLDKSIYTIDNFCNELENFFST